MHPFTLVCLGLIMLISSGCQIISPLFVDYYGVRRDVAQWINQHQLLSMQQKRLLVQLSRAQQQLRKIESKSAEQQIHIMKENMMAIHCATPDITEQKIQQLQDKIFDPTEKQHILDFYNQQRQNIQIDLNLVKCGH